MHVFIPVFFRAPLGGLQSHVRAQAQALLRAGHRCTVMCRPGPFADSLRQLDVTVLTTEFEPLDAAVDAAEAGGPYDLVHAHPFLARQVGVELARRHNRPCLLTLHSLYLDGLPQYAQQIDLVIAVSAATRDFVIRASAIAPERVAVIPNGVDTDVFQPQGHGLADFRAALPAGVDVPLTEDDRRIFFPCRLDPDKQFILDAAVETWREVVRTRAFDQRWLVAGDGALRDALQATAAELNAAAGRPLITFLGWLAEPQLARLYSACHVCVAPGRSALDCMACGRPVIAIGSKGYVGLIDAARGLGGMYTNFGGFGADSNPYRAGQLFADLDGVIHDDERLDELGQMSSRLIQAFYRQCDLDERLLGYYALSAARPSAPASEMLEPIACPALAFRRPENPAQVSRAWVWPQANDRQISVTAEGSLSVAHTLGEGAKFYVATDSTDFTRPPRDADTWSLAAGCAYELRVPLKIVAGAPAVQVWVIEYGAGQRPVQTHRALHPGENRLSWLSGPTTRSFRVALRFSGSGHVEVGAIELAGRRPARATLAPNPQRLREVTSLGAYAGENLVIVLGPPRSGTTWVLQLLATHPDIVAASLDNLDVRLNDAPTLETNIFNDNRPFTDAQIKARFFRLSKRHPAQVIVEKTPVHLLFVDRIRQVFPRAALVLTERDGRDVVNSLVHVGRDPNAWWRGAPDSVEKATTLWKRYAEAALRCRELYAPLVVCYEELLADPGTVLTRLLTQLGLSCTHIAQQIEQCQGGRNIPIAGVFREGQSGSWRRDFSPADVAAFEATAGDLLVRSGYERAEKQEVP